MTRVLEIVHLRLAGDETQTLLELVQGAVAQEGTEASVHVFRHAGITSDLAVHIVRGEVEATEAPSDLGNRIASILRWHGLVEHSVWIGVPSSSHE